MFSRCLLVCLMLFAVLATGSAVAAGPAGPRLAIKAHDSCCGSELITVGPTGEQPQSLAGDSWPPLLVVGDRPSWSADGNLLAFSASASALGIGDEGRVVAVARADGGGLRVFPRSFFREGADPVVSPDSSSVVFQRVQLVKVLPGRENLLLKSSLWVLDLGDGSVRQLTRWRLGNFLWPSSFSPDGSTLAATSFSRRGLRAVAIDLRSRRLSVIARDAWEPTYSPDGSRVAFVRRTHWLDPGRDEGPRTVDVLVVAHANGGAPKSLFRRRAIVAWPSWDPSGERLAFTLSPAEEGSGDLSPEEGDKVMAINADGTCLTKVFSDPELTLFGSAWQPGVGREAGPISC